MAAYVYVNTTSSRRNYTTSRDVTEERRLIIKIGIDPHKSSLTAVAVHPDGHTQPPIRLIVDRSTRPPSSLGLPSGPSASGQSKEPLD